MHVLVRSFLLITSLCFLVACPAPPNGVCKTDADCTEEGKGTCCIADGKEEGECKAKSECTTTKECDAGVTSCLVKSDCKNNQVCTDGCCQEEAQGKVCEKDADCDSGKECGLSGGEKRCRTCAKSCSSTTDCSGDDTCDNGCCRLPPCSTDDDCKDRGDTKYCDTTTQKCVVCTKSEQCQADSPKSVCQDNICEDVECVDDSHCQDPRPECNTTTYKCEEPVICRKDEDCVDAAGQLIRCDPSANNGKGQCKKGLCVKCSGDDECGGSGDFCIGTSQNLKDGNKCLTKCETNSDCQAGLACTDTIVSGFKICFPVTGYCEDPCKNKQCQPNERCELGVCIKIPEPCDKCTKDEDCGAGNSCLSYGANMFCGRKCTGDSDCPAEGNGRKFVCLSGQCTDENQCQ
ncbi:MAG TPA: hypothetical protein DCE42_27710 [Myxococcales bacterium]|nr:hypothetical protein [Myxococcales bacterium]